MFVEIVTPPTVEPISLVEAKLHLRVDHTDDDTLITALIVAVRQHVEATATRRALITQTWDVWLDRFFDSIDIPRPPLQSVTSIDYTDSNGDFQTLDSSVYRVVAEGSPGRVELAYNVNWPDTQRITNAVKIRYVAGYGAAGGDVPQSLLQGMYLLLGHYYENRENSAPVILSPIPYGARALLDPYLVAW